MDKSRSSKVKDIVQSIEDRIRRVFNNDFFSIYEGIVEGKDNASGTLKVRVPELNDTLYEECRVMAFCSGGTCNVTSNFILGTNVIIGFKAFNLKYPIILGQISPEGQPFNQFVDNSVVFQSSNSQIIFGDKSVTIATGNSSILITESGIAFNGDYVTACGEDLTCSRAVSNTNVSK
jgi:uncharacterized Zn-binding protein involved in type VI secretion